jgi:hypothetical protein
MPQVVAHVPSSLQAVTAINVQTYSLVPYSLESRVQHMRISFLSAQLQVLCYAFQGNCRPKGRDGCCRCALHKIGLKRPSIEADEPGAPQDGLGEYMSKSPRLCSYT